jgi:hypothetical protein
LDVGRRPGPKEQAADAGSQRFQEISANALCVFFHLALMLQICPSALGPDLLHLNCRITIVRSQNSHFVKVCVPLLVVASANAAINDFEMLLVDR